MHSNQHKVRASPAPSSAPRERGLGEAASGSEKTPCRASGSPRQPANGSGERRHDHRGGPSLSWSDRMGGQSVRPVTSVRVAGSEDGPSGLPPEGAGRSRRRMVNGIGRAMGFNNRDGMRRLANPCRLRRPGVKSTPTTHLSVGETPILKRRASPTGSPVEQSPNSRSYYIDRSTEVPDPSLIDFHEITPGSDFCIGNGEDRTLGTGLIRGNGVARADQTVGRVKNRSNGLENSAGRGCQAAGGPRAETRGNANVAVGRS